MMLIKKITHPPGGGTVDYFGQFCAISKVPIDLIEEENLEINGIGSV